MSRLRLVTPPPFGPYPRAEQIARALWIAAGPFGERFHLRCAPRRVLYGGINPPLIASWYVLAALDAAYLHLDLHTMARWVGLGGDPYRIFTVELGRRRRDNAWDRQLERALFFEVAP